VRDLPQLVDALAGNVPNGEKPDEKPIDGRYKDDELKKLQDALKKQLEQYEKVNVPRCEHYAVYEMMIRGENPFHRYEELPNFVVNATHPACDTAEAKMISALFDSDLVYRYRPRMASGIQQAKRVERFIQQRVTRDIYNSEEVKDSLRYATRFGTGVCRITSDDASHVEGIYDPLDIDDTSTEETDDNNDADTLNLSLDKNVRIDAVHPANFLMWPTISHINRQPYVIEICYLTDMDMNMKAENGEWDKDGVKKILADAMRSDRWADTVRGRYGFEHEHPYYDLGGDECIVKEHHVADISRIDGWTYTLVDHEIVVKARKTNNNTLNGGHPYSVYQMFVEPGWAYGFGIPAMIISQQDRLNTIQSMQAFQDMLNTFPNMIVDGNKVDHDKWENREIGQVLYTQGDPNKLVSNVPGNYGAAQLSMAQMDQAFSQIERQTGITEPVMGMDARSHRTASEASITDRNAHSRLDGAVRSFIAAINQMGKLILRETKRMFESGDFKETEYFRINDALYGEQFEEITKNDFIKEFDVESGVDFSINAGPERAGNLLQYLQVAAQIAPETLTHGVKMNMLREMLRSWNIPEPEQYYAPADHLKESKGHMDMILAYGILPTIRDNDMHEFHIMNEMNYLTQPDIYQNRPAFQLIVQHIEQHKHALMNQQIAAGQMNSQQLPQGGMGGGQPQGQPQPQQQGAMGTAELPPMTSGMQPLTQGVPG